MDIKVKIFSLCVAVFLFYAAYIGSKGIKHSKWNIVFCVAFSLVGGVIVMATFNNCNYGVCNL